MLCTYCFNGILLVDLSYVRLKHYSVHEFLGMKLVHDVITFNNKKFNVHKSSVVKDYVFRILIMLWRLIFLRVQKLWTDYKVSARGINISYLQVLWYAFQGLMENLSAWYNTQGIKLYSVFIFIVFISPKRTIHRYSITMYIIIIVSCKEQVYDNKWDEYCDSLAVQFDIYLILSSYNISQKHPITF